MSILVTVTGACPTCGHALKLYQAKARPLFLGCSPFPRCTFRCAYDPVLQQLRDHNARLQAELTLLQMQHTSPVQQDLLRESEDRRRQLTTWRDVAQRWIPPLAAEGREARS
jgi:ssDNA-binding Zn-finger/Zn-ribbon topoisomerase 1